MGERPTSTIGRRQALAWGGAAGLTTLAGCSGFGGESSEADLLADAAVPLETTEPSDSTADLEPLTDAFADASIVGLGEATYGTREFSRAKHRLLQFLVTELDVRVFAWEDGFGSTRALDEYVRHGEGDAAEILWSDGVTDARQTESVLEMIEWIRSYNEGRDADERVAFYGFDAQYAHKQAGRLLGYVTDAGPPLPDDLEEELTALTDFELTPRDPSGIAVPLETAESVAESLRERLEDERDEYVSASSEAEWERARRAVWSMGRAVQFWQAFHGDADSTQVREESMAENVTWILEHEDADRMAIWAHTHHVGKGSLRASEYIEHDPATEPPMMGQYLASEHGDDYYALGFEFGYGSFRTPSAVHTVDDVAEHRDVAAVATEVADPTFVVDFDSVSDSTLREFLEGTHHLYDADSEVPDSVEEVARPYDLTDDFDGLLFVEETNETRLLSV